MMYRRTFIKSSALASVGLGIACANKPTKTHILSLSFDDGFKKSFYRVAEIHEAYGLRGCFNVIAQGHVKGAIDNQYIKPEIVGDFNDWNKLKARGHEIMPHTWVHKNLTEISLNEAKENLEKCFEYFEQNLDGYNAAEAVYNYAFNASSDVLDEYILTKVKAIRTGGWLVLKDTMLNNIPTKNEAGLRLGCWADGPELCDDYIEKEVNQFLAGQGGWLILNLHGLDNEGWGPVSTDYYDQLLKRLVKLPHVDVLPVGEVINA